MSIIISIIAFVIGLIIGICEAALVNELWYLRSVESNDGWAEKCREINDSWYEECLALIEQNKRLYNLLEKKYFGED